MPKEIFQETDGLFILHGGRNPRSLDAVEWAKEVFARGAGEILLTSMDRDGTKDGYDIPLPKQLVKQLKFL